MKVNDKVRYTNATDDQVNWGDNDDPRESLQLNHDYIIRAVDVHSWHTKIQLRGIKGTFNSTHFVKAK
ncbi:hypothetical protein H8D85_01470 [bacterium]|nr:hypothetical protein [bacterium]